MNYVNSQEDDSTQLVGKVLRSFYRAYGMPKEGPPDEFDLSLLDSVPVDPGDLEVLRKALGDS